MRSNAKFLLLLVGLLLLTAGLLEWQWHAAAHLRGEIDSRRHAADEWMRLDAEHRHIVSAQVKPDDLKKLAADRHAISALLGEIEAMRRRADATGRITKPLAIEKPVQPAMERGPVPASLWKNAGQATPQAAFETLLWASAGGDLDSLAHVLHLNSAVRIEATEVLDQLPPAMQQEIATPERLIALLTAKGAPMGSAEILSAYEENPSQVSSPSPVKLNARVVDVEGNARELLLSLRAENGTWRLVVPDNAIEKYAILLQMPAELTGSTDKTPQ